MEKPELASYMLPLHQDSLPASTHIAWPSPKNVRRGKTSRCHHLLAAASLAGLVLLGIFAPCSGQASTIWDGPLITFTEPAGGVGSNPANQDRLTPDVWLTRNITQGLFNAALEISYTSFSSPANTEWAYGSLANYATLTYTNWEGWNGHNPPSMVGRPAVVHLITDDVYLSLEFLSWPAAGGGFSYERSTLAVPEPSSLELASVGAGVGTLWRAWRKLRARRAGRAL